MKKNSSCSAEIERNPGKISVWGYIGILLEILIFLIGITTIASSDVSHTLRPVISVRPMSVNFGSVRVGAPSNPKTVTIKNTGNEDLIINSITITGVNQSEFVQTNNCSVVPAKSSCPITVTFNPALPFGKKIAIMSILSNDPKTSVKNVKLLGQAPPPKISVSLRSVHFGSVPVGAMSTSKMVTIKNTGISDLKIDSISINTDTADNEFSQTSDCSVMGKDAKKCTINVTFSPTSTGNKTAIMSISSNDPKTSVKNVSLFGGTNGFVETQSIAGIWMGAFTSNINNWTFNVVGIITESGLARFAVPSFGTQYSGVVHVSGNSFSSTAETYGSAGIYIGMVNIAGTFTPKLIMNGTYSGVGDKGIFSLAYNSLYERPSSLTEIVGNWTDYSSGYYQTVTIDLNGNITSESIGGCIYSGNVSIIDSSHNIYHWNLNVNNCGAKSGVYNGLAILTDTDNKNDTLLASASNSTYSFVAELRR